MKTALFNNLSVAVRSYWENLNWDDIADIFGNKTKQRGREYAQNGNVKQLWMSRSGRHLLAAVQGNEKYYTHIRLKTGKQKNKYSVSSQCTCPVGPCCKHAVAAIAAFLDRLANHQPVPLCKQSGRTTWKVSDESGKVKNIVVDFDAEFYDDNRGSIAPKQNIENYIKQTYKDKSSGELIGIILSLVKEYDNVREHFEQLQLSASAGNACVQDKLLKQILTLINREEKSHRSYGGYYDEHSNPFDFTKVAEIIKQFNKFGASLPAFDIIADKIFKIGKKALECSDAEESDEFDIVIEALTDVLKRSKADAAEIILWAYKTYHKSDFGIGEYPLKTLKEHHWTVNDWSTVADRIFCGKDKSLSCIRLEEKIEILDKAQRQGEATDLLRREAKEWYELQTLIHRLIKLNLLDEAEQRIKQLCRKPNSQSGEWNKELKAIAEKRSDWITLASIQAAEFFTQPNRGNLQVLIKTIGKLKDKEKLRKEISVFLETGILPGKNWTLPPFEFAAMPKKSKPHYAVLCQWAIDEKRADDVLRWYDVFVKSKATYSLDKIEVADAVADRYPERALDIYCGQAEYEFEQTRHYEDGIKLLRKAKVVLEKMNRINDWKDILAEVRICHKRKSKLMKLLDELEAGSIVKQKRSK
ncbi:hypothetical protein FACS18942_09770 [Planctomycetales bacterium]|nr:hypothetical protein FACS18942_09770 [Planctomycetales bacterium]